MGILIRRANERGFADHGWLRTYHTFSFADYHDPHFMGFGPLRVINEDRIAGGAGFATHGHRDMEILSYVISGALHHRDSMGNETTIRVGELQRMSAGTGVRHSEYNHLSDAESHFLQIWILPEKNGLQPGYEQKSFAASLEHSDLVLVASRDGREGALVIHQEVDVYAAKRMKEGRCRHQAHANHFIWLQVVRGQVDVAGAILHPGDGIGITQSSEINISWANQSEFLIFDMNVEAQ